VHRRVDLTAIIASATEVVPVWLQIEDRRTDLFPQAEIFDRNGTPSPIATLNLSHVDEGLYLQVYTVPGVSKYVVRYVVYSDALRTTVADQYGADTDLIISDLAQAQADVAVGCAIDPARLT
jgi:hypothetical protein